MTFLYRRKEDSQSVAKFDVYICCLKFECVDIGQLARMQSKIGELVEGP